MELFFAAFAARKPYSFTTRAISGPHPRIYPLIYHVRQQIHKHISQSNREQATLHQRIVAIGDGADGQPPQAWPTEDGFRHNGPGQQSSKLQANDGNDGNQGVGQGVAADHSALAEALGAGGAKFFV